jgi:hypothetical protein
MSQGLIPLVPALWLMADGLAVGAVTTLMMLFVSIVVKQTRVCGS